MSQQLEGAMPHATTRLLCQYYLEKMNRERQEILGAAMQSEPERAQQGFQLDIERGIWVRPVQVPAPEAP